MCLCIRVYLCSSLFLSKRVSLCARVCIHMFMLMCDCVCVTQFFSLICILRDLVPGKRYFSLFVKIGLVTNGRDIIYL